MEEQKLLNEYLKNKRTIENLHLDLLFTKENEGRDEVSRKIEQAQTLKEDIKSRLQNMDNKESSVNSCALIKVQHSNYITFLESIVRCNPFLLISRHQGMVLKNYFFGIILTNIKHFVEGGQNGPYSVEYTFFTNLEKEGYNIDEIIDFLRTELQILEQLKDINYIVLEDYFNNFKMRLIEQFDN